ncbi:MAG: hypothetical protein AAF989_06900 [Planctomycetota bacterium]
MLRYVCLDYIRDWRSLFAEITRILKPNGLVQFSCGHPAFDAEHFVTKKYFSVGSVHCTWKGFGIDVEMPSYRRSLQEVIMPLIENGLWIEKVIEPTPNADFLAADPTRHRRLMHRLAFLCVPARLS